MRSISSYSFQLAFLASPPLTFLTSVLSDTVNKIPFFYIIKTSTHFSLILTTAYHSLSSLLLSTTSSVAHSYKRERSPALTTNDHSCTATQGLGSNSTAAVFMFKP